MATENNILERVYEIRVRKEIVKQCGENPIADGIVCPHCNCPETFKPREDVNNTERWFFMIRAFRVDNYSHCRNCCRWFAL